MANSSTTSTAMWGVMAGSWLGTLVELDVPEPHRDSHYRQLEGSRVPLCA